MQPPTRCLPPAACSLPPAACCLRPAACSLPLAASCLLRAACCLLLAACCLLAAVCCLRSAARCVLPAACFLLPAACWLLSSVCCPLPAACYLLPAACCLLPGACCLQSAACCLLPGYMLPAAYILGDRSWVHLWSLLPPLLASIVLQNSWLFNKTSFIRQNNWRVQLSVVASMRRRRCNRREYPSIYIYIYNERENISTDPPNLEKTGSIRKTHNTDRASQDSQ